MVVISGALSFEQISPWPGNKLSVQMADSLVQTDSICSSLQLHWSLVTAACICCGAENSLTLIEAAHSTRLVICSVGFNGPGWMVWA